MNTSPLEERPNPTAWDALLQRALPALDHVFGNEVGDPGVPHWTLGGGTALALRIAHRLSDDIDLFVPTRPLKVFTPRENPGARAIGSRFQWPGAYLKFECGDGEIDFLSPHLQTSPGFTLETYRGRRIALETLAEVTVKKVRFWAARFTSRDVFDLAAVGRSDPSIVGVLARETGDALPRLRAVILARSRSHPLIDRGVRPTEAFADLESEAYDRSIAIVDAAIEALQPRHTSG